MQAIEVTIFLVFAVIAAGFMMVFLFGFDFQKFQTGISNLLTGEKPSAGLQKVSFSGFLSRLYGCWQECISKNNSASLNDVDCGQTYLESVPADPMVLETTFLQTQITSINYCEDCNVAVVSPPIDIITIPAVVNMSCDLEAGMPPRIIVTS